MIYQIIKENFTEKKPYNWMDIPFFGSLFLCLISFFDKENYIFAQEIFIIYDQPNLRSYFHFLRRLCIFL